MEITDIRVRKLNLEGKMKAVVSITFDNAFVVHDIKVIEGSDKLFIAMPSRKTADGEFKDVAHPINAEMREMISSAVLKKYEASLIEETQGDTQ
jgi:stage V sporulation protein G